MLSFGGAFAPTALTIDDSYCYALFVAVKEVNSFIFKQIQTLSQNTRSGGCSLLCVAPAHSASQRYLLFVYLP